MFNEQYPSTRYRTVQSGSRNASRMQVVRLRVACERSSKPSAGSSTRCRSATGSRVSLSSMEDDGLRVMHVEQKAMYADAALLRTGKHAVGNCWYPLSVAELSESNCPRETPSEARSSVSNNSSYFLELTKTESVPELYPCRTYIPLLTSDHRPAVACHSDPQTQLSPVFWSHCCN